jgi:aspartate aminotransferase
LSPNAEKPTRSGTWPSQGSIPYAFGKTVGGRAPGTHDEIRKILLESAGLAVVPFQAFGLKEENGWFRLSVGAVSMDDIAAMFPRLRALLDPAARGR